MPEMTTIKVPRALRQRIAYGASRRGLSAAVFLAELLDRDERDRRLAAVGEAYAAGPDAGYREETGAWDDTAADGLPGATGRTA